MHKYEIARKYVWLWTTLLLRHALVAFEKSRQVRPYLRAVVAHSCSLRPQLNPEVAETQPTSDEFFTWLMCVHAHAHSVVHWQTKVTGKMKATLAIDSGRTCCCMASISHVLTWPTHATSVCEQPFVMAFALPCGACTICR